jgi:hypothetical protein
MKHNNYVLLIIIFQERNCVDVTILHSVSSKPVAGYKAFILEVLLCNI